MQVIRTHPGELPAQAPEAPILFVIPHSAGSAFVWCSHLDGAAIGAIHLAGKPLSILERKKLVRPGHTLEVLLIEGVNLRDGVECELHVTSSENDAVATRAVARLARWEDADTPRALRLIATRFTSASSVPAALERYLAYISAWQAPSRVLHTFPDGAIVAVEAAMADDKISAFAATTHGLRSAAIQPLLCSGGTLVVWLSDLSIRQLYLELSGALIRVNLDGAHQPSAAALPLHGIPIEQELVTALHSIVVGPSDELKTWAAAQCRTAATTRCEETTVEVRRAVRLPSDDVAVLIDVVGAAHGLDDLQLRAFADDGALDIEVVTREGGEGQQIIVRVGAQGPEVSCYHLSWLWAGRSHAVWIRETSSSDPSNVRLARDFMAVALVAPEIFPAVLHPLATAPDRYTAPGLVRVAEFGSATANACADVFVFAGDDLEALHRTILGLSLTSRETALQVQVCVFDPGVIDRLLAAAQAWSRTYHLPLKVACYSARTSEAQVVRQAFRSDRPRIFCRAGTVPRCSEWISQVLQSNKQERGALLFANPTNLNIPLHRGVSAVSISTLLPSDSLSWADRLMAAVVLPHSDPDRAPMPGVYTLEGFLLAYEMQGSDRKGTLRLAPDAPFVQSGTSERPDDFYAKLDAYSLQQARAASLAPKRRTRPYPSRMAG
jgi:hypothetical protein